MGLAARDRSLPAIRRASRSSRGSCRSAPTRTGRPSSGDYDSLAVCKTDGSIWQWTLPGWESRAYPFQGPAGPPRLAPRLGCLRLLLGRCYHAGARRQPLLRKSLDSRLVKVGPDSDWAAIAGDYQSLSARKTDGSIWQWDLPNAGVPGPPVPEPAGPARRAPRLGGHRQPVGRHHLAGGRRQPLLLVGPRRPGQFRSAHAGRLAKTGPDRKYLWSRRARCIRSAMKLQPNCAKRLECVQLAAAVERPVRPKRQQAARTPNAGARLVNSTRELTRNPLRLMPGSWNREPLDCLPLRSASSRAKTCRLPFPAGVVFRAT